MMAALTYTAMASLDGFISDADGRFDFAHPDAEVHAFVNDLERPVGTYLYGRRLYETMAGWETMPTAGATPEVRDYAELWRAADKVVYSTTLDAVATARTRLERTFDPGAVRALKDASAHELSVGGAGLAAAALRAGLVDEVRLLLVPAIVGGGTRALPDGVRAGLDLLDEHRFRGGTVYLRYAVTGADRRGRG
jgi:dihydrofolate reductase